MIHLGLLLFAAALVTRAAQVQLWQGDEWASRAERQHVREASVPAPRGDIVDATGVVLARSRALVRLHVAPREVRDRGALRQALDRLGVAPGWIDRAADRKRKWVSLPGKFLATEAAAVAAIRGVHAEPIIDRAYAAAGGIRQLVGRIDEHGTGAAGLELAMDSLLRGTPGTAHVLRDAQGRRFDSPTTPGVPPRAGHSVVLTVNARLQEIAERALADAVSRLGAQGGDILMVDPSDGAILAMASMRQRKLATSAAGFTEPFEPGSTLKPFVAAGLLERGRARATDVVSTSGGKIELHGRTIHDVKRTDALSLADVIRWSSNVGIVQLAQRLSWSEEYETLRDFGFGTPTGVPYPSEAAGTLRVPSQWSLQSPASLAMGYEIAVTPLQLALAYASIANGGELLEPILVREVRTPEGEIVYEAARRRVRRVMSEETAALLRRILVDVVERGSAVEADLATYRVGGKTGTARRASPGEGYVPGQYTATFVGMFPAEEPQYVVLVKLDDPEGAFGGLTAAPVSKVIIEAALAARDAALDRTALAARVVRREEDAGEAPPPERIDPSGSRPYLVTLPASVEERAPPASPRRIPDVRGLPLRGAVATLHRAGFRVRLARGTPGVTAPAPGTIAGAGTVVRLSYQP